MSTGAVRVDASELTSAVYEMRARGRNLRRALAPIGEGLIAAITDVFDAEGPNWEPLTQATIDGRRGTEQKILQDWGIMKKSLGIATGPDWVEVTTGVAYGEFHATGTRHMPKRNPFELGPFEADFLEDAAEIVAREIIQ